MILEGYDMNEFLLHCLYSSLHAIPEDVFGRFHFPYHHDILLTLRIAYKYVTSIRINNKRALVNKWTVVIYKSATTKPSVLRSRHIIETLERRAELVVVGVC